MNHQINSKNSPKNSPIEILHVNSKKVSCQGERGDGATISGHPLVYLNMGANDFVTCPYCSKFFTIKEKTEIKNQIKDKK